MELTRQFSTGLESKSKQETQLHTSQGNQSFSTPRKRREQTLTLLRHTQRFKTLFFQKSTQESGLCFFLAVSCARATRCPQDTSELLGAGTGAMQKTPAQRILLPGPLLCEIASSPERKKFCSWVRLKRSGQLEDDFTRFGCLPLQIRTVASASKLLQEVAGAPKTPTCNWDSCTHGRKLPAEKALSGNKKRSWGKEEEGMQTPSLWKEINHQRGIQHKQRMTE